MVFFMNFSSPLKKGTLKKRYKRFFADIEHQGEVLTAHLPNTGSLKTVPLRDTPCWFSTSNDPKRKLKYTLEFIETERGLIGVNTRTPNAVTYEALLEGLKADFDHVQPELKISEKSRIDFVLWSWKGPKAQEPKKLKYPDYLSDSSLKLHFIEVKNVTMAEKTTAYFPDGVTERGQKHLQELIELKKKGFSTEILFFVQRENIETFQISEEIDPKYFTNFKLLQKHEVKVSVFKAAMSKKKVSLNWADPIKITN